MPKYTLHDALYGCEYRLYINIPCERFISIMGKYLDDISILDGIESTEGMCVTGLNGGGMAIYIREFDINSPKSIATLVHECVHITQRRVWQECGVDCRALEATAYHIGWLVEGFLTKIRARTAATPTTGNCPK